MIIGNEIVGSGDSGVIVLHGWFGDHTVFAPMMSYLDTDTFTYAFINYRGYGLSRDMAGEHTMREIADDAVALADHLGWQQFHVIGHSMGGMAMMRIATDHPGRIKSGVALTPVPPSGVPLDEDGKALFHGAPENDANRRMIIDFTTGGRLSGHWLDETNFAEESKGNATPLLVCPGEFDGALTADVMKQTYLEWYPNAELSVLPNSGHYPMQETPVYLATVMENFMRDHL